MGLDCSHDAWHGPYSAFMRWRMKLAEVAGLPPLELMDGFYGSLNNSRGTLPTLYHGINTHEPAWGPGSKPYMGSLDERLPIRWECLKPSALHELLYHSDCDGEIDADRCVPIGRALDRLAGSMGEWEEKTRTFAKGLRRAAREGKPLLFR